MDPIAVTEISNFLAEATRTHFEDIKAAMRDLPEVGVEQTRLRLDRAMHALHTLMHDHLTRALAMAGDLVTQAQTEVAGAAPAEQPAAQERLQAALDLHANLQGSLAAHLWSQTHFAGQVEALLGHPPRTFH
jgi:hypothetical protein